MSNTPRATSTASHPESEPEKDVIQWEHHLRWLAPASVVILVVAIAFLWWQRRQSDVRAEVYQAYAQATTAEAFEQVANAWPDQPEAPLSLLQAGALHFNDGNFEAARIAYSAFAEDYADHPLADGAAFGVLLADESLGNLQAALDGFRQIGEDEVLYPRARLGEARVLERMDKWEEAKAIYEDILETFPNTSWGTQADTLLQGVEMRLRMNDRPRDPVPAGTGSDS